MSVSFSGLWNSKSIVFFLLSSASFFSLLEDSSRTCSHSVFWRKVWARSSRRILPVRCSRMGFTRKPGTLRPVIFKNFEAASPGKIWCSSRLVHLNKREVWTRPWGIYKNFRKTIEQCHSTVGVAILNTSITIVFGFSILILSNFIPTIYFGIFTGIAMLLAMISVLTLLPSLLLVFKPFKIK